MTIYVPSSVKTGVSSRSTWWSRYADPLTLIALGTGAVTQPLLSDFRAGAGYFVARRNEPIEIVLLVVIVTLFPGVIANLAVWAADAFSERARAIIHSVFVGLFATLIAQISLMHLTSTTWLVLAISVVVGAVSALAYHRSTWFRTFLRFLIPAPLIFALFFLFTPPVSGLVFPANNTSVESNVSSVAPIVFIVLDEFPVSSVLDENGDIDTGRYPNFARLAAMSTWYKYTASAHEGTLWALPAILSAQEPDNSLLPTTAGYPGNIFTLLYRSHELHVTEPFSQLCPPDMCEVSRPTSFSERLRTLIDDAATLYAMMVAPGLVDPAALDPFGEFNAGRADRNERELETDQVARFAEFLRGIRPSGPHLHFLHLFLPHSPFRHYPSTTKYNNGAELVGHESDIWVEPVLANQAYQRHLLQVQAVDVLIGDMIDRLESVGILDDAIVVVTADHGVNFRLGNQRRALTEQNRYDIGLVPLFIKAPNQEQGVVDTTPARSVDILPTVAAFLDVDLPWPHDGQSLLSQPRDVPPLLVQRKSGDQVLLDEVEAGLSDALRYKESVFGKQDGVLDLFSLGENASLLGLAPEEVVSGSSGLTANVDEAWRLAHVAPGLGFLPGFLHGELRGSPDQDLHVAVALNGKIRTVVPIFDADGRRARFSAILPETAFIPGFNRLELLAVSGSTAAPVVATIELSEATGFEMQTGRDGGITRIVDSSGMSWPVVEGSPITGFVDQASWNDPGSVGVGSEDLHLGGWAVNEEVLQPAERIVFFVNGVFAGSAGMDSERPDIEDGYGVADVRFSGFTGKASQFLPVASLEVRVFALSQGIAEELPLTETALADVFEE